MYFLIAGTVLFFATHLYSSFRSRQPGRDIRARLGQSKYMGLYSLLTGFGFVLMIWGYGLARPSPYVFSPPAWGQHLVMALMLPAFIFLAASYSPRGYIKQSLGHPMLYAVILWSAAHLATNGELNSLILFGSFLAYAVIDRFAVMGRASSPKSANIIGDILAIIIGVAAYWVMIKYLHPMLIGVAVLP